MTRAHDARRLEQTRLQVELGQIQAADEHQHMLHGMAARGQTCWRNIGARTLRRGRRLQARNEGFEFVRGAIRIRPERRAAVQLIDRRRPTVTFAESWEITA
jgi:hypothetical protein